MTPQIKQVTKDQLVEEFDTVVADTAVLLNSAANAGVEKAASLRASVEQNLAVATDRLRDVQRSAVESTEAAARATDRYVHRHPWQTVGIVAGATAVLGVVIGLLLNRR
jgi:ElaB/YqjD/DUF883 family membrane-anchored ribosome-binding protein